MSSDHGAVAESEIVYLVGGPRDNETLLVPRDDMVATVTHPHAGASIIHAVGSEPEQPLYQYSRSRLPDGWPAVFAFVATAGEALTVERVMAKLAYRGKAPPWRPGVGTQMLQK